jgi:hypothetical protein
MELLAALQRCSNGINLHCCYVQFTTFTTIKVSLAVYYGN